MNFSSYHRPDSLDALYERLEQESGRVLFLSGGTDVLVQDRESGRYAGRAVYDLTAIPALKTIRESGGDLYIGGEATHGDVADSTLVQRSAGPLACACSEVGAVQLRNRATISGNIANASPAGDSLGPLAALDAVICGDCLGRLRWIPITELIEKPGRLCLAEKEFIREIKIPKLREDSRWRFRKVGRRNALAISRLTLTVILRLTAEETITDYRAAVGAAFPRPMRFAEAERPFVGRKLTESTCREMAELLAGQIPRVAGVRASTRYKQPVTRLLCERLLREMRYPLEQYPDPLPDQRRGDDAHGGPQ